MLAGFDFTSATMRARISRKADLLDESVWLRLGRPAKYDVNTTLRVKRDRVNEQIVVAREYLNNVLQNEYVAELNYRPRACKQSYRMIVIRKNLSKERGERVLVDEILYFFYITNDRDSTAEEVVFSCNDRCNQENMIEQLKNGPCAFRAPVDNLYSNWAYMVMASVAWSLKAWSALWRPETGRWKDRHHSEKFKLLKLEFRTFVNTIIRIPCQIITPDRRSVYRLADMERFATHLLAHGGSSEFLDLESDHSSSTTSVQMHLISKSVCFDRSSRFTAATLLNSLRCRIQNPTQLKRLTRFVCGCAARKQNSFIKTPVRPGSLV